MGAAGRLYLPIQRHGQQAANGVELAVVPSRDELLHRLANPVLLGLVRERPRSATSRMPNAAAGTMITATILRLRISVSVGMWWYRRQPIAAAPPGASLQLPHG